MYIALVFAGFSGVSIGLGVLLVGLRFWLYKYVKRHRKLRLRRQLFKRNGGLLLQQQLTSREDRSVEKTVIFTSKEIEKATENFSSDRILGQGGQGTVYKGMLPDGRIVAVKKAKAVDKDQVAEFINEVVVLTQINHRNIVSIFGFCLETEVPVLVYEYIPNGNVFELLHGDVEGGHTAANWELRWDIAKDTAHALGYLHSSVTCPIYHKDVKTANIMLDHKHRAKLADFGTSRVISVDDTHLTTPVVSGTPGYLDPEYHQSSQYTDRSDVYSYGVVLAELLTGEEPYILQPPPQHPKKLAINFLRDMKEKLLDIIDPRIRDDCALDQVKVMAKIARLCLNRKGEKRPTMSSIIMELERIGSSHGDSQAHHILETDDDEDDDEEQAVQVRESFNIDVASTSATQPVQGRESFNIDVASTSATQPMFPRQTY
ncbi:unnamed protein product [Microthlaspi erraticum]|uniref:Protein kinase domain-containing protein n=1 Tax=Microthlaspi erraticum TaxID=1685480 RepID=A0A6D2L563_9BRAS|nr:unnamed protein product [Microthlaspi erraticum]